MTQSVPLGETVKETFTYTVRDADGDTTTATLTIDIIGKGRGDSKDTEIGQGWQERITTTDSNGDSISTWAKSGDALTVTVNNDALLRAQQEVETGNG